MGQISGEFEGEESPSIRKIAFASTIGSVVEWYDFFIYGTAAALVFNQLFFPTFDPLVGTLAAFGTFAVGFIARPLGGVVCGHYGDRIGRKAMLILTLMVMGIATLLIGLLPTYGTIGILAPILLVVLRFIQGFGLGGEVAGAQLMIVEYAPAGKRGYYGAWPMTGSYIGLVLSTAVLFGSSFLLTGEQFLAWGWRVGFVLSAILIGVGLYIRLTIMETPVFRRIKETHTEARMPIIEVIRTYPKQLLLAIGMYLSITVTFYVVSVFSLAYANTQLGMSRSMVLALAMLASIFLVATALLGGALSDRIGRRPIFLGGTSFIALMAFPFFWLMDTREPILVFLAMFLLGVGVSVMVATQGAFFAELFGTRVRYTGVSIGIAIATLVGGAITPSLATALVAWSGGSGWPVAAYVATVGVISFLSTLLVTETFQSDIAEDVPEGRGGPQAEV
jgi:MFS transporter, MHS family, shikimate and dehydroshikimate transport protein